MRVCAGGEGTVDNAPGLMASEPVSTVPVFFLVVVGCCVWVTGGPLRECQAKADQAGFIYHLPEPVTHVWVLLLSKGD